MRRRYKVSILYGILGSIGLILFALIWANRNLSFIIPNGPFAQSFSDGIYPDHSKDIEKWFYQTLSKGASQGVASDVLKSSFSIDLTSGNPFIIVRSTSVAGGQSTSITLRFSSTGFEEVHVTQRWVYY